MAWLCLCILIIRQPKVTGRLDWSIKDLARAPSFSRVFGHGLQPMTPLGSYIKTVMFYHRKALL